jgi:hypothetical protein
MLDNETITLLATKIGGQTYPDDYTVTWRGLRIGRIRKNPGLPAHLDQWSWGCNVYGQPPHREDSGQGADLEDCKAKFKIAWARKCTGLTDRAIIRLTCMADPGYFASSWFASLNNPMSLMGPNSEVRSRDREVGFAFKNGHRQCGLSGPKSVESRCGAVALGRTYVLPPLSFGGASLVLPWLRFHIPAHRTGQADFPHPALGQDFTLSRATPSAAS